jgi:hypothetical protein
MKIYFGKNNLKLIYMNKNKYFISLNCIFDNKIPISILNTIFRVSKISQSMLRNF